MVLVGMIIRNIKLPEILDKVLDDENDINRQVTSITLIGGGASFTIVGVCWLIRSRNAMLYYLKQTHYSATGKLP